ncbi:MAG: MFS transporter, partial [Actinobacteria bacterium]|nr:MFS transporter [Actinomycetota bacterium]
LRSYGTRRDDSTESSTVRDDLIHGWREFISRKWVVAIVAGYSIIAMLFESALAVVGPYHAKESLGGPQPWSWIMAALCVGSVLGVVVTVKFRPRRPLFAGLVAQIGMVAWFASLGVTYWIPALVLTGFLCGFALDFFMVLWQTAMQSNIPRESLSRVVSYDAFGSLFFAPLGVLIAGPIAHRLGTLNTFTVFAIVTFVVLIAMLLVPEVRNLKGQQLTEESAQ